jgi:two-component sensor histidine kinase
VGLIINELMTNSVKHAFAGEASGDITVGVAVEADSGQVVLRVADGGCGMSEMPGGGSGMDLFKTLAQQMGGTRNGVLPPIRAQASP